MLAIILFDDTTSRAYEVDAQTGATLTALWQTRRAPDAEPMPATFPTVQGVDVAITWAEVQRLLVKDMPPTNPT